MATYSNLNVKLIATGDESGTWGTSTNTNWGIVDQAIAGYASIALSDADATYTATAGAAADIRNMVLTLTGTLTDNRTLTIAPNTMEKVWIVKNSTSGSKTVTFSQGTGANVIIPNGGVRIMYTDGAGSGAAVADPIGVHNCDNNIAVTLDQATSGLGS